MQTVIARLPNNPKILKLTFSSNGILGGISKSKTFYKYKVLSKSAVLKDFYWTWHLNSNPLTHIAPYFIILLCLTPDDFARQGESAGA